MVRRSGWILIPLLAALAGCRATYNSHLDPVVELLQRGQFDKAASVIERQAQKVDGDLADSKPGVARSPALDAVPIRLEQGTVYMTAGMTAQAVEAFERAEDIFDRYDQQAVIQLGNEGLAAVTNLSFLPYRGRQYERIMSPVYRAIALMELGDFEQAGRAVIRITESQVSAADKFSAEIQKENAAVQREMSSRGQPANVGQSVRDDRTQSTVKSAYKTQAGSLSSASGYAIGEGRFLNPLADYIQGLFYLAVEHDAVRARNAFERIDQMLPSWMDRQQLNLYRQQSESLASGGNVAPTTHVIFAQGFAPRVESFKIDLPLILVTDRLSTFNIAIPFLQQMPTTAPYLSVSADGVIAQSTLLADMDEIVAAEFNAQLSGVITKSVALAILKAGAAVGIQSAARGSGDQFVDVGAQIATLIYNTASNQADLRTWRTLPKTFSIVQIPTPRSGIVRLQVPGESAVEVRLTPGALHNLIYVRHTARGGRLSIHEFRLSNDRN